MTTSSFAGSGFGCVANSNSFAESLSTLEFSTGLKTLFLSLTLFAFFVLARAPFALILNSR